jgi:hypothetical protein
MEMEAAFSQKSFGEIGVYEDKLSGKIGRAVYLFGQLANDR